MAVSETEIHRYLVALLADRDFTADVLKAGEEHYIPRAKAALRRVGVESIIDDLGDRQAQEIKYGSRTGQAIAEDNKGAYQAPPGMLRTICDKLQRAGDDLSDAFTIATTFATIAAASGGTATNISCALIGFTVVRMGVRHICADMRQ